MLEVSLEISDQSPRDAVAIFLIPRLPEREEGIAKEPDEMEEVEHGRENGA